MSADAMIVPALLMHPFAFGGVMKQIFGIDIPHTLEDVCQPRRLALLIYDMQVGITSQVKVKLYWRWFGDIKCFG